MSTSTNDLVRRLTDEFNHSLVRMLDRRRYVELSLPAIADRVMASAVYLRHLVDRIDDITAEPDR